MPYKVFKEGEQFKVYKLDADGEKTGKPLGTHDERGDAEDQVKALYANEKKEKSYPYYSGSAVSFADLESEREAVEAAMQAEQVARDFHMLVDNIMWKDEITDKAGAVRQLANEFSSKLDEAVAMEIKERNSPLVELISTVKKALKRDESDAAPARRMFIWKGEGDTYKWLARYSNNFRDNDNPPEIISSDSHKKFAALVDEGVVDPPKLWLWHIPQYEFGEADWVTYDDVGFAYAGGHIYPEHNELAKAISRVGDVGVSHGMPLWSIRRDEEDPSIITQHITEEISPLPFSAAANKLTEFVVYDKESNMAIPKEKREKLIQDWGIDPELLKALEEQSLKDATTATASGVQSKDLSEATTDTVVTTPAVEAEVVETEVEVEEQVEVEQPEAPVVEAAEAEALTEVAEVLGETVKMVTILSEQVKALRKEVKDLQQLDEEKVAKQAASTPLASLMAMMNKSVVGEESTAVDGRTKLAKSAPQETKEEPPTRTGLPLVDGWLSGSKEGDGYAN